MKKKKSFLIVVVILLLGGVFLGIKGFMYYKDFKLSLDNLKIITANRVKQEKYEAKLKKHYNKFVVTNKETNIYIKEESLYKEVGKLSRGIEIELNEIELNASVVYFSFNFNNVEYFINFEDVEPIENIKKEQKRYEHYVAFDENIITNDEYKLYKNDKLVLKIKSEKLDLPIYIKEDNSYGVVINEELFYIKKEDVSSTRLSGNATKPKANSIATVVYHFIYDQENDKCDQIICHSYKQVNSHINFIKENDYFTLTMKEFEMFLDKKINVQKKSLLITVDDGWYGEFASELFTKNEINASIFVVTSWYDPKSFETEFVEVHSHSDNLHNTGVCQEGQGGAIQCLDKELLLEDLKKSREKTNMTTSFCYPFYEYNNYSISVLKEAGFTMGFGGTYSGGSFKAYPGYDKFQIPRITFLNTTTVEDLKGVLEG